MIAAAPIPEDLQQELGARLRERQQLTDRLDELDQDIAALERALTDGPKRGKGHRIPLPEAIRAARTLAEFSVPELAKHLRCSPTAAQRLIDRMTEREIIEFSRVRALGVGRPARIYSYVPPPATSTPQTASSPGAEHGRRFRRAAPAPAATRPRAGDREVDKLVGAAHSQGFAISRTGSGHLRLSKGGESVVVPSTPSDHRSVKNARAALRRAGLAV